MATQKHLKPPGNKNKTLEILLFKGRGIKSRCNLHVVVFLNGKYQNSAMAN